jgi:hypothetical protein
MVIAPGCRLRRLPSCLLNSENFSFGFFSAVDRHCNTDEAVWSAGAIAVA